MTDMQAAAISAHRANLRRYCSLLTTNLTELEREFIHRRIAETRLQLERLETKVDPQTSGEGAMSMNPREESWGYAPCL